MQIYFTERCRTAIVLSTTRQNVYAFVSCFLSFSGLLMKWAHMLPLCYLYNAVTATCVYMALWALPYLVLIISKLPDGVSCRWPKKYWAFRPVICIGLLTFFHKTELPLNCNHQDLNIFYLYRAYGILVRVFGSKNAQTLNFWFELGWIYLHYSYSKYSPVVLFWCFCWQAWYFDRDDVALKGFHKFFKKCSEEEREHAEKMMKYQNLRGGRVVYQPIDVCWMFIFICSFDSYGFIVSKVQTLTSSNYTVSQLKWRQYSNLHK